MSRRPTLEHPVKTETKKWEFEAGLDGPAMTDHICVRLNALLWEHGVEWPPHELLWVAGVIAISHEGSVNDVSEHVSELDWHWSHPDAETEVVKVSITFTRR